MTDKIFIDAIAEKSGMTKKDVKLFARAFEECLVDIMNTIDPDKRVKFGDVNFVTKNVAAHVGRNPATGEEIEIPEHKRISVSASTTLKRAVR